MSISFMYNLTVDIIRDTFSTDGEGTVKTPVILVSSLPSHIAWIKGRQRVMFNKDTHYLDAVVHCRMPEGVTVKVTDRVLYDGEYFEIVDTEDVNNLGTLLRIAIRKVT